jgi:dTDP-4-amino-4,6-dideoxygalactose transaminase
MCNAMGSMIETKPVGSFGDAAIYSFGYAKIIEHGFGGAVVLNNDIDREGVARIISSWPESEAASIIRVEELNKEVSAIRNSNASNRKALLMECYRRYAEELECSLSAKSIEAIEHKLESLNDNLEHRKRIAGLYHSDINTPFISKCRFPEGSIYWRYNLHVIPEHRDALITYLRSRDILCSKWYPPLFDVFPLQINPLEYPGSSSFAQSVVNLFTDYRISISEAERTIQLINQYRP